jgi:hypothetical protein
MPKPSRPAALLFPIPLARSRSRARSSPLAPVLFGKWSGTEVKIDGQDLLIMKESDIMGVMDK